MSFDPALLHLLVVISDCLLAGVLAPEIPVQETIGKPTSPTSFARAPAFGSMYVAAANRYRYASDVAVHTLTSCFRDDSSVGFCCAKLRRHCAELFALEDFYLVQAALFGQAVLLRCELDCFI